MFRLVHNFYVNMVNSSVKAKHVCRKVLLVKLLLLSEIMNTT